MIKIDYLNKLKIYTSFDEYNDIHYSKSFYVIEELPEIGDYFDYKDYEVESIKKAHIDSEQGARDWWLYDYYYIKCKNLEYDPETDDEDMQYTVFNVAVYALKKYKVECMIDNHDQYIGEEPHDMSYHSVTDDYIEAEGEEEAISYAIGYIAENIDDYKVEYSDDGSDGYVKVLDDDEVIRSMYNFRATKIS